MAMHRFLICAALLVGVCGVAKAQPRFASDASSPLAVAWKRAPGYIGPQGLPDASAILPPPPAPRSQAEAFDQAVFLQTRALQGGQRWALATQDAIETPVAFEADVSCALGFNVDPASAPATTRLITRLGADAADIVSRAKDRFGRPRPFVGDSQPICVARTDALTASPSYPSGHATFGWTSGLVLAEIEPDRATEILARARAFGESRAVCGVHYVSDVEAGRTTGAILTAVLHTSPAFRADLDAARQELTALRARSPVLQGGACKVSDEAAAHTPWAK